MKTFNFYKKFILVFISTITYSQVSLDLNFGVNGKVITSISGNDAEIYGMAIQPNGKIVTCGIMWDTFRNYMVLSRYNTDGTLDEAFGDNGIVNTNLGTLNFFRSNAVTIQNDGKILLAGATEEGISNYVFALTRYLEDGTLDPNFGINGVATTDFSVGGGLTNGAETIAIDTNNRIIMAGNGSSLGGADDNFAIVRYNSNGTLDNSFGIGGRMDVNIGTTTSIVGNTVSSQDDATSVKILSNGKLIFAGRTDAQSAAGNYNLALLLLNSDGTIDTNFGSNGKVIVDYGGKDIDFALAVTSDNKFVVCGSSYNSTYENCKTIIAKFNYDGSIDNTFGTNGSVISQLNTTDLNDALSSIILQADGKILTGGYSMNSSSRDFLLLRMNSDGTFDTTFSPTGYVTTDFGQPYDISHALLLQNDNKILLAGESGDNSTNFALARYVTGSLSNDSFLTDKYTIAPNPSNSLLTVSTNATNSIKSIEIVNLSGQLVTVKLINSNTIDVAALKSGVYFIQITNENSTESLKFIKN